MHKIILPSSTIGIIGGGQLGRMLTLAAKQMGYYVIVLDPVPNGPCAQVADHEINAPFNDLEAIAELVKRCDVVTYEFENISGDIIENMSHLGYIPQGAHPLKVSQNRINEKQAIVACGFKTAPFVSVGCVDTLGRAITFTGLPAILKTCTGGYDGKGQVIIRDALDLDAAYALIEQQPCILEGLVDFKGELSVIVNRSTSGEVSAFPIGDNVHQDNILYMTTVPSVTSPLIQKKAQELACELMTQLDFVGTLAVELFLTLDDELIVNELAPRPHNSGHYTIEACVTSQFEQHIRAICGLPLGLTTLKHPATMVNILGQDLNQVMDLLNHQSFKDVKLHLYGKMESKLNRKMGHLTYIGKDNRAFVTTINQIRTKGE